MEQALYQYAWLVPVLPLLGATLVGTGLITFGEWTSRLRRGNAVLILLLMGVSLTLSVALFWSQVLGHDPYTWNFTWAVAGPFHLEMGLVVDRLSSLMLVIVTTVALLVMIYSDGYMAHDRGYSRFFAYLSLFSASMLGLVLSPNLVQVYVFWELVGMCSYLLIGFWYDRVAAREAAQKAFVVNRVGDFGLLLGILGFYWDDGQKRQCPKPPPQSPATRTNLRCATSYSPARLLCERKKMVFFHSNPISGIMNNCYKS